MLTYQKGDVTEAKEQVIAHGVNCLGHFGSGVAGAIKRKHPYVREQYLSLREHHLGTCQFVEYNDQIWVNAHTQYSTGYDGKQYADLNAVAECLVEIDTYMRENNLSTIAMPKIGCGLGGLSWEEVGPLVDVILEDHEVVIYEL
jgi:O-acetyl-ADP-ribose deacetylase (regulator of RNase III)